MPETALSPKPSACRARVLGEITMDRSTGIAAQIVDTQWC